MHRIHVPEEAHSFGAFRGCEHSDGRLGIAYAAVMEAHGPSIVATALAGGQRAGMLCDGTQPAHPGHSAVLDIVDANGDVLADRCIPTVEAWGWWHRAIELRATSSDCSACEPAAYTATYSLNQPD